ncbi:GNAT family N-acetyltransferase [Streptomyces asoensis]|uniref:GNAT family N-acetyltransferase n=1 Tax=Streptomyces asoensis TaxID=249586 RepID=UPI003403CE4B
MREDVVVRPALVSDAPGIARLSEPFVADDLLVARSGTQFRNRIGDYLTAVQDSRVIGCVGLTRLGDDLLLYNLCVAADRQGLGIGGRMVERADALAVLGGCRFLLAASKHSGRWFVRHGFTRTEPQHMPAVWADLLPPGRGSHLYRRPVAPRTAPPAFTPPRQGAERS